jgi:deoxycytidylate deaminase
MSKAISRKFWGSVEIARALRPLHSSGRCFHVTTIYDKNKLIVIGANNYNKTHPKAYLYRKTEAEADYIPTIHSELSAILKIGEEDCSDLLFFNVRIDRNDKVTNSHPCSGCTLLLQQTGFKKLFYSTDSGDYKEFYG